MKPSETKFVCDLISLTANAVATRTIPEAQDYIEEKYNSLNNPLVEHAYNTLTKIYNKQKQHEI